MGTCYSIDKVKEAPEVQTGEQQLNIIQQIQNDFIVLSDNENVIDVYYGQVTILDPRKVESIEIQQESMSGFRLAQKVLKFSDKQSYKEALMYYENRFYGLNHPNLCIIHGTESLQIKAMQNKKVDEFFNTDYIISLYLDYPTRTFQREMLLRQRSWFNEQEVLYILDSLVGALAFLQSKGISHQHLSFTSIFVVILPNGMPAIKICDQRFEPQIRTEFDPSPYYPSPEQMSGKSYDEFKSDVFTLGLLLLEICTLSKSTMLYDQGRINEQLLNELLPKVGDRYSERLFELMRLMLQINPRLRPDFLELDEMISHNFNELSGKRISQTWQYSDYQYCIQDKPQADRASWLTHPDTPSKSSTKKNLAKRKSMGKQLSSIKQGIMGEVQSNFSVVQSNLSIMENFQQDSQGDSQRYNLAKVL